MARIRSLKPGYFKNEDLAELPYEHRLLFAGLWLLADREGRLEDRPRRIKGEIFPYDSLDVDVMLTALDEKGFVVRYVADGVPYLAIPNFLKHQRPKSDETPSLIPAPLLENPRGKVVPPRPYNGQRDLGSGQRTEDSGADGAPRPADGAGESRKAADVAAFAALWNELTHPPISRCREVSSKRRRQIRIRLTERPLTEWGEVFRKIQASSFCRGENDRGWVATFDWVAGSPEVSVKVLEGKYDDRGRTRGGAAPTPTYADWSCPHEAPKCRARGACHTREILEQGRRQKAAS